VTQLLDLFGFISVMLRGLTLSFEALTIGGVIFLLVIARQKHTAPLLPLFAGLLAITSICSVWLNATILRVTTNLSWPDVISAPFGIAGALIITGGLGIIVFARTPGSRVACPIACAPILAGSIMNSHSFARLVHQRIAMALTGVHHLAGAAWIGGLLYLLLTLRKVR
jgi:putative copper resistance protein D